MLEKLLVPSHVKYTSDLARFSIVSSHENRNKRGKNDMVEKVQRLTRQDYHDDWFLIVSSLPCKSPGTYSSN